MTVAALVALLASAPSLHADEYQQRRIDTGVRLFRALLAADLGLARKATGGHLLVLFFYAHDRRRAEDLARLFAKGEGGSTEAAAIKGMPVAVDVADDAGFAAYASRTPAGIFITDPPEGATLRALVDYGIANRVIVYSPFEGDVEKGVLGGLAVEAQVRPYINLATLNASQIELKEFFLKVTKVYR